MGDSNPSSGRELSIDFSVADIFVRSILNPAKTGHTTGRVVRQAGRDYALLRLKSGEIGQVPCEHLELVPEVETRAQAMGKLRLAGPEHLHRAILTEKMRGRLTDIFYSMGTGHAEFYPHQFKPVLKLVSSTGGRILIADEVGLGKTIEAIYVWKELQARFGCRRLLVVCPSMLQQKWQAELRNRFGIDANIVDSRELLEQFERTADDATTSFVSIGSIESLRARRPREDDSERPLGPRQILAAFLAENEAPEGSELLDLVIIDEAHYLRNPATAANYLATLLASASSHLVLLTATPIQLGSENLFQLLTLLDADRYANLDVFNAMRRANAPITAALNAATRIPADPARFQSSLQEALKSPFFVEDQVLRQLALDTIDLRQVSDRMLRSKSEVIIANLLHEREVPFRYEQPLFAGDGTIRLPDFTITWKGKTYYWEHLGLLEQTQYAEEWKRKREWYERWYPGQLLTTEEGPKLSKMAADLIDVINGHPVN